MVAISSGSIEVRDKPMIPETLSDRLVKAMQYFNISQSELARRIGIKPQTVQYLCSSKSSRSKFVFDIADALGINPAWLATGEGKMISHQIQYVNSTKVPLIKWHDINKWLKNKKEDLFITKYVNVMSDINRNFYALQVQDTSMSPRFEIGTILIADPNAQPQENDFVIVTSDFSEIPIIRHLVKINNEYYLAPSNYGRTYNRSLDRIKHINTPKI